MSKPSNKAVHLGSRFHAEPGETKGHLWDVYTTHEVGENDRIHVGQLWKAAVDAWAFVEKEQAASGHPFLRRTKPR